MLATLAFLPPILVVVGLAAALFGLRPGLAVWAWLLVGYAFFFGMFGALLDLPSLVVDLSPFSHLTVMPLDRLEIAPLVVLTLIAAVLLVLGRALFQRRDLDAP